MGKAREILGTITAQATGTGSVAVAAGLEEIVATVEGILVGTGGECEATQAGGTIVAFTLQMFIVEERQNRMGNEISLKAT